MKARFRLILLALTSLGTAVTRAQTMVTWSATPADANFNNAANWTGGLPDANSLVFDASIQDHLALSATTHVNALTFTGTYPHYYLNAVGASGAVLGIGAGGVTVANSGAGVVDFSSGLPILLDASQTWTTDGDLSVSGGISVQSSASLTKSGPGTLTLGGAGAFPHGLSVTAGTVALAGPAATLTNSDITLSGEGTLTLGANDQLDASVDLYFSGTHGGTGGKFILNGHSTTVGEIASGVGAAGLIANDGEVPGTLTVDFTEASRTFDGTLRDNSGEVGPFFAEGSKLALVKAGSGILTLAGNNTYSGGTTISGGSLIATNTTGSATGSGLVEVADGATLQIGLGGTTGFVTGDIANDGSVFFAHSDTVTAGGISGSGSVTQGGTGTLRLLGSNPSSYCGPTFVGTLTAAGTLEDDGAGAFSPDSGVFLYGGSLNVKFDETIHGLGDLTINDAISPGTVTLSSGATLTIAGSGSTFSGTIGGAGKLQVGSGAVETLKGANSYAGGTAISGTLVIGSDAALGQIPEGPTPSSLAFDGGTLETTATFTLNTHRGISITSSGATFETDTETTLTYAGVISGAPGALLTKTGSGTLILSGTGSNPGKVIISDGTLAIAAANAVNTGTDVVIAANGTLRLNASQRIRGFWGLGTASIADDTTFTVDLPGGDGGIVSAFGGALSGSGAFVKAGPNILTLAGASPDFAGSITVSNGTLLVTHAAALGQTTAGTAVAAQGSLLLYNVAVGAEPLSLSGTGATPGTGALIGTGTVSLSGPVTLAGDATVSAPTGDDTLTLSGSIGEADGTHSLTKVGGGRLVLSGPTSTYTGSTNLKDGTLQIGAVDALPTATALGMADNTKLLVDFNQTIQRFLGSISDVMTEVVIAEHQTFTVFTPSNAEYSPGRFDGTISGAGAFAFSGDDGGLLLDLGGDNTYSGGTTVTHGILVAHTNTAFGTGAVTVNPGGVLGLPNGVKIANPIALSGGSDSGNRAFIAGFGSFAPSDHALVIGDHAGVSPGAKLDPSRLHDLPETNNSPVGTLFVGTIDAPTTVTFGANGLYDWGVQDLAKADGAGSDLLEINGNLTFAATAEFPFTFRLSTFDSTGAPGLLTGFDPNKNHQWTILTATNGITGFDPNNPYNVTFNAGNFLNAPVNGAFSLTLTETSLVLKFAAVPEPSTWVLLLTGLAIVSITAARRKKSGPAA